MLHGHLSTKMLQLSSLWKVIIMSKMPVVIRSFGLEIIQNGTYFSRFGAIFNMARLLLDDFRNEFEKGPWWQRLFNGYSFTTWLVVLNLGSTGLLVSWLMKYADNIVKVTPFTCLQFLCFCLFLHKFILSAHLTCTCLIDTFYLW